MTDQPLKTSLPAPFSFSQSSLQDYFDCNRRFQLRYVEQLHWPAVESAPVLENERRQAEGQLFHRMVQQYLIGLPEEKISSMAASSGSPDLARWWDNFLEAGSTSLAGLGRATSLHPEISLSAPFGKHRLVAKYDLITISDGRASIYDWKTYHNRPRDEWMKTRMQTRVYQSLLVEAGAHLNGGQPFAPEQVEMIYWYAEYPAEPARFTLTARQFKREKEVLENLISEIAARQSFPLTDDEQKCGYCPYRSYCERGVLAAEAEETGDITDASWEVDLEQIQEIEF
ncbi:MAG TPA: PD-(D/E)XK nuclease family protein [Anaerolineales bacterium]|jgi:CRISPR/Cas system-associated exonuclease Cas4 (RecB family)